MTEVPGWNWLSRQGHIHTKALNTLKKSHKITNHLHFNVSHVLFQLLFTSSFNAATTWQKWSEFHLLFLKPLEQKCYKCQALAAPSNTPSNPSWNQSLLIFYWAAISPFPDAFPCLSNWFCTGKEISHQKATTGKPKWACSAPEPPKICFGNKQNLLQTPKIQVPLQKMMFFILWELCRGIKTRK